ncbi:hypothetical protein EG68_04258 [Paragonimus skrjabini miyazakii]|uniref:Cilia- and flagella-associated protein 299 n=1 Tax=Paragonimus skrjabini miyazakii TaxID=59628 RepID=A0A8S9YX22_9TREM|nr:hypothetical protein EG68_04258 [Paragonimus skrjabini miyazakii]
MDDNVPLGLDNAVTQFNTYEDFLDSQITATDLFYLEDEELARQLVELGYRGSGEIVKRDDFNSRKIALAEAVLAKEQSKKALACEGLDIICPVARALASREDANRTGKMSTIIFIRDLNTRGQEISGYIDYAYRLKTEDFTQYFTEKKKLLPRPGDLSFYNWETQNVVATSSPNYTVLAENPNGLLFKNKRDRKILNVDPSAPTPGDNSTRTVISTEKYLQAVIYDHITRRKT